MSVIVTVVVPESPPICPPMSFAWMTTKYSSLASLSMLGRAVLIIATIMGGKKVRYRPKFNFAAIFMDICKHHKN